MHIRFSTAVGTSIFDDDAGLAIAKITGIAVHPDTGKVAGFFVYGSGFASSDELFVSVLDIVAWGTVVHVRSRDAIVPACELVRLQSLLVDPRTVLGQRILTQQHHTFLGVCRDLQFDTRNFVVEWLFPYKYWFLSQLAVSVRDIVEVTPQAIIVKEPLRPSAAKESVVALGRSTLPEILTAPPVAS